MHVRRFMAGWMPLLFMVSMASWAGGGGSPPIPTIPAFAERDRNKNEAYVGIQWDMMARSGLTAVVGYRWAEVDSDNDVQGATTEFTYTLTGPKAGPGEFRIKALDGGRSTQGELGAGYSFSHDAFLLNGGVQGENWYGAVDYLLGPGFKPYFGVNTIDRYRKVQPEAICPSGWVLGSDGICRSGTVSPGS